MRRGRPPYPDLLTPREQEVLELLRQGLTNQQIADRLGIGVYGARYHVSEILSKLGVSSREEAAAWRGERAYLGLPFVALLFGHVRGVSVWKLVGGVVLAMALAGIVVLAIGVIASRGAEKGEPEVSQAASPTPQVTPGPTPTVGPPQPSAEDPWVVGPYLISPCPAGTATHRKAGCR